MTNKKHYIAMSGIIGCLPEACQSFDRLSDAIDYLTDLWDDHRGVKTALRKYWQWNNPDEFSLDYCEITECYCNNPEVHNDL